MTLDDGLGRQLPPAARTVWQLENVIGVVVAVAVALAVFHSPFSSGSWRRFEVPVLAVIAVLGLVEALVVIPLRHRYYRYAFLDDCVVLVRGRVVLRRSVFPLHQVLYVETRQGPVLRRFGLFTMHLGTIAEPHSLGPLPRAVVEELQGAVEARTRTA